MKYSIVNNKCVEDECCGWYDNIEDCQAACEQIKYCQYVCDGCKTKDKENKP